jgi:molybdopterin/thiamine biosynthesis adenylyltransferase/rhodanese-related sulfurtransferase
MTTFTAKEYLRYTRHIQLPQVGAQGQTTLKNAHALIIGCGGLGAPVSLYLAAAGVGTITVVDGDTVELSNLQRQITFVENDVGCNKAQRTQQRLQDLNSDITVHAITEHLDKSNASALIAVASIVLDCTDSFNARCLINEACREFNKAWVYASLYQFSGQCAVFTPIGPCFNCLFSAPANNAPNCNVAGVLGALPGLMGTIQANEALKYLLGLDGLLESKLLLIETSTMDFQTLVIHSDPGCSSCGNGASNTKKASDHSLQKINAVSPFAKQLSCDEMIALAHSNHAQLIDVRSLQEHAAFNLGGLNIPLALIKSGDFSLKRDKPIMLYCQAGPRSAHACALLIAQGFDAGYLEGGLAKTLATSHAKIKS